MKNSKLLEELDRISKKLVQLSKENKNMKLSTDALKEEHKKSIAEEESMKQKQDRQLKEC